MAQAPVAYQVESKMPVYPEIPAFPVEDGLPPSQRQQLDLASTAMRWELECQVAAAPKTRWETAIRNEPYPAWAPFRFPGSATPESEADPLLVFVPSQMLIPWLDLSSTILLLRPANILLEDSKPVLSLPSHLPWLCIHQGFLRVDIMYPSKGLPSLPLDFADVHARLARKELKSLNQANSRAQDRLGNYPYWVAVLPDPDRLQGYPL